jgi:hypothetical protein
MPPLTVDMATPEHIQTFVKGINLRTLGDVMMLWMPNSHFPRSLARWMDWDPCRPGLHEVSNPGSCHRRSPRQGTYRRRWLVVTCRDLGLLPMTPYWRERPPSTIKIIWSTQTPKRHKREEPLDTSWCFHYPRERRFKTESSVVPSKEALLPSWRTTGCDAPTPHVRVGNLIGHGFQRGVWEWESFNQEDPTVCGVGGPQKTLHSTPQH